MTRKIYYDGIVRTVASPGAVADWVLVEGGRVLATGRGAPDFPGAARIDLAGRTVVPGFIDPHGHFPESGFNALFRIDLAPPPVGSCGSLHQVLERISRTPGTGWVHGVGFDHTALPEGRFPTRDELDGAMCDRPVWLIHASGHAGALDTMAMDLLDVRGDGYLAGLSAMGELGSTDFDIDEIQFAAGIAAAGTEYLSHGVTLTQNSWTERRMLDRFVAIDAAGCCPVACCRTQTEFVDEAASKFDPPDHGPTQTLHRRFVSR